MVGDQVRQKQDEYEEEYGGTKVEEAMITK